MSIFSKIGGWLSKGAKALGKAIAEGNETPEVDTARLLQVLRRGDVLVYGPHGWIGWGIAIKTGYPASHCEFYEGDGQSSASRDMVGVGTYPLRAEQLSFILRPVGTFDYGRGLAWHRTVEKAGYDYRALAGFYLLPIKEDPNAYICSEYVVERLREEHLAPSAVADDMPAYKISPADLVKSPAFVHIGIPWK